MLISSAFAQDAASGSPFGTMTQFLPLILIFAVFYFLLIRPQQQKQKAVKASLAAIKRGDRVVTGGGILGLVTRPPKGVEDREIEVEIAPNIRVIVLRETISAVIQPQPANDPRPRPAQQAAPAPGIAGVVGMLKGLFGKR
jgi:preprotein translocase subunit YajC